MIYTRNTGTTSFKVIRKRSVSFNNPNSMFIYNISTFKDREMDQYLELLPLSVLRHGKFSSSADSGKKTYPKFDF